MFTSHSYNFRVYQRSVLALFLKPCMSLKEEQLSAIKAVYEGRKSLSVCPLDMGRANSAICYGT